MLKLANGEERAGADLQKLVENARSIRNLLNGLHSRYNRKVIEQAAIAGVLTPSVTGDPDACGRAAAYIARRLDRWPTKPSVAGKAGSIAKASISSAWCAASRKRR